MKDFNIWDLPDPHDIIEDPAAPASGYLRAGYRLLKPDEPHPDPRMEVLRKLEPQAINPLVTDRLK